MELLYNRARHYIFHAEMIGSSVRFNVYFQ